MPPRRLLRAYAAALFFGHMCYLRHTSTFLLPLEPYLRHSSTFPKYHIKLKYGPILKLTCERLLCSDAGLDASEDEVIEIVEEPESSDEEGSDEDDDDASTGPFGG